MGYRNNWNIQISGAILLSCALMLLVLPIQWVAAVLIAAFWHELCHILAVRLCGGRIYHVNIGDGGTIMESRAMTPGREVICVLAGPLGSLLLLTFVTWFPRTALCGCFQGLYNLIPVYPLDGGRALQTVVFAFLPQERAESLCTGIAYAVTALIIELAIAGTFVMDLGAFPLLLAGFLLFRMKREKLLANFRNRGYNRPTMVKR